MLFFTPLIVCLFGLSHSQDLIPEVSQSYSERVNHQLEQQVSSFATQGVAYTAYASFFKRADVALPGFSHFFCDLAKDANENARSLTDHINSRGGRIRFPVIQVKEACDTIQRELSLGHVTRPLDQQSVTSSARRQPRICYFSLPEDPIKSHKKKDSKLYYKNTDESGDDRQLWQEGLYGLEDALAMERAVRGDIESLAKTAGGFGDPQTRYQLKVRLATQTKRVYKVAELMKRLQKHQSLDSYSLEEFLLDQELAEW